MHLWPHAGSPARAFANASGSALATVVWQCGNPADHTMLRNTSTQSARNCCPSSKYGHSMPKVCTMETFYWHCIWNTSWPCVLQHSFILEQKMGLVGSKVANIHTVSSKHWAAHWTTIHRGTRKQWSPKPLWNKGHAYSQSHGNIVNMAEVAVVHSVSWKAKHGHCNLSTHSLLLQSFALASSASFLNLCNEGCDSFTSSAKEKSWATFAKKTAQHANSRTSTLAVGKRELLRRSVLREHGQGPIQ